MERKTGELITREALEAIKRMQSKSVEKVPTTSQPPSTNPLEAKIKVRKYTPLFDVEQGKNI